jgi:SAM-dependent methyltransferase
MVTFTAVEAIRPTNQRPQTLRKFSGRTSVLQSMLPCKANNLLDVGCGPLRSDYSWAAMAEFVTCVDWRMRISGSVPRNVLCLEGDFTSLALSTERYDVIVAADVFEHISLEREQAFVDNCVRCLKPGGSLLLSLPHSGTFALLDPYRIKPALCRQFSKLGLYSPTHNGHCDIRKGHKHYALSEIVYRFSPLKLRDVVYFGYLVDPLIAWTTAVGRRLGFDKCPAWLHRAYCVELSKDYAQRSFNIAVSLTKTDAG